MTRNSDKRRRDRRVPEADPEFFRAADPEHVRREKAKARELRRSQWWKNRLAPGTCHYCRARLAPQDLTMDHVVPLVRGGKTRRGNVVPCCRDCNHRKKYLLPSEWQEYLDTLADRSAPES